MALFLAEDGETGRELRRSDGTAAGTFQGKLIFIWRNGLWQADGTTGGTVEIPGSFREPRELTVAGPRLFFAATDPAHGRELWALE